MYLEGIVDTMLTKTTKNDKSIWRIDWCFNKMVLLALCSASSSVFESIQWPPRSPDLFSQNIFLWTHLKKIILFQLLHWEIYVNRSQTGVDKPTQKSFKMYENVFNGICTHGIWRLAFQTTFTKVIIQITVFHFTTIFPQNIFVYFEAHMKIPPKVL